jgi:ACT domain-containing protein
MQHAYRGGVGIRQQAYRTNNHNAAGQLIVTLAKVGRRSKNLLSIAQKEPIEEVETLRLELKNPVPDASISTGLIFRKN